MVVRSCPGTTLSAIFLGHNRRRVNVTHEAMQAIAGLSRADAWFKAVNAIIADEDWEAFHLVVEIADATKSGPKDQAVEEAVNGFLIAHNSQPLQTVAETIFPASEYRRYGRDGVYNHYPERVYSGIKDGTWGTYAYRLLRRWSSDSREYFNPLEECVGKIRRQLSRPATYRACYEIDLSDSGFDLHTYDGCIDRRRLRGGPCLSHLGFKINGGRRLLVTATYRYHFYIERFLGNLLGLAQLQRFICDETGLEPGPMLCVSSLATIETGQSWGKGDVRALMREATEIYGVEA